jgi:DNA-binding response OmpR family regulator
MLKKKVLIIEDDPAIQELIGYILESEGFEVVAISHNSSSDLPKHQADLILLDEWINKKEGHMLCKEIKEIHAIKHIPVIILSTAPDVAEIAKNCQADGYLAKPFDIEEIVSLVNKVLGNKPVNA